MPCYVRFHTREYLESLPETHYDDWNALQDDEVGNCLNDEMLETCDEQGWHQVDCEMFSRSFYLDGWTWFKRWVAEWSLDGVTPVYQVQEELIVHQYDDEDLIAALLAGDEVVFKRKKKKPTAPPVLPQKTTRTITLESVESTGKQCGLCFYKGFKCFTSECNRRYWRLIESIDKP